MIDLINFQNIPSNPIIFKALLTMHHKINNPCYKNISVSISGGADSDIMLNMVMQTVDKSNLDKLKFIFFDTGVEYQATKKHLEQLEVKYGITLIKLKPKKSIGVIKKEFGSPFLSKFASKNISILQKKGFNFATDKSYEELILIYPRAKTVLGWWFNKNSINQLNINYNKGLKEFLQTNPPDFKISSKCCDFLKKDIGKEFDKLNQTDLNIIGIRRAEGGIRTFSYNSCFSKNKITGLDTYRPLFFFSDKDKLEYKEFYNIEYSECYTSYGMKRTGCCGCPFNKNFIKDLEQLKFYEPKMYTLSQALYFQSYEYTKRYLDFKKNLK
ncbi:hypothetical protein AN641_03625 [Candidatus Epulonipiscioides gigas]|uniref:Uncharacterized protein n=1 Tax=Candidatus Epulonipiscium fishelsonii TaxID=77094 RepID=A0ACC8XFL3_9FIRM|nr:hypothetical protein AN396_02235 [Epulopiscium sp. SCG-B11WGA-EpuloA1]ONI45680.1 hypothetical protein AN641_03625 [Epulopiscium sp. SCG-C07WGA-EpuloA2]